jgi:phosphoglycolate phosphatase-like HAD superfamily hydrolase
MAEAMAHEWGVQVTADDIWAIDPAGRTDRAIARLVLRGKGLEGEAVDRGMPSWMEQASARHARLMADFPAPVAAPDADDVAVALAHRGVELALVTGNLEPIGRAKVAAAGLGHHFGPGGGFGGDSEERADLVRVARTRAAAEHADADVVVVGDTPRDIAAARAAGVRVLAVTTGAHDAHALRGADQVVPDLATAAEILLA